MTDFHSPYTFMKQSEMRRTAEPYREVEKPEGGVMWVDWEAINEIIRANKKERRK